LIAKELIFLILLYNSNKYFKELHNMDTVYQEL